MMILPRKANFLISNPALARPRQGEIKVQQLGVSLMDLKFKNMSIYRSLKYRDLVVLGNLSSVVIEKDKTHQLLSFFPADASKERFPSQEYLFSFAIPHPVPNIAGKLMFFFSDQSISFVSADLSVVRFQSQEYRYPLAPPPQKKTHPTISKI